MKQIHFASISVLSLLSTDGRGQLALWSDSWLPLKCIFIPVHADLKQGSTPILDIQTKQKTTVLPDSQKRANCEKDWKLKSSIILNLRYFSWKWRQIKLSQSWQREQFWLYCCRQSTSNLYNFSIPTQKQEQSNTLTKLTAWWLLHWAYCPTRPWVCLLTHLSHQGTPGAGRDMWNNLPSALLAWLSRPCLGQFPTPSQSPAFMQ